MTNRLECMTQKTNRAQNYCRKFAEIYKLVEIASLTNKYPPAITRAEHSDRRPCDPRAARPAAPFHVFPLSRV